MEFFWGLFFSKFKVSNLNFKIGFQNEHFWKMKWGIWNLKKAVFEMLNDLGKS